MENKIAKTSNKNKIYFYCAIILFSILTAVSMFFMKLLSGNIKTLLYAALILLTFLCLVFLKTNKDSLFRFFFLFLIFSLFFALLFLLLDRSGFWNNVSTVEKMRDFISSQGVFSYAVFFAVQFLQVVLIPIPGVVTITAGIVLYGPLIGSIISYVGIVAGAIVAFIVGRKFGYKLVVWVLGEKNLEKTLKIIKGKDKVIFAMMFLLPFFPDDMLCFVAGLTPMSLGFFVGMVMITRLITIAVTTFSAQLTSFLINTGSLFGYIILAIMGIVILAIFILSIKYGEQIQSFYENKIFKKFNKSKTSENIEDIK